LVPSLEANVTLQVDLFSESAPTYVIAKHMEFRGTRQELLARTHQDLLAYSPVVLIKNSLPIHQWYSQELPAYPSVLEVLNSRGNCEPAGGVRAFCTSTFVFHKLWMRQSHTVHLENPIHFPGGPDVLRVFRKKVV